jgi:hypothetical protein
MLCVIRNLILFLHLNFIYTKGFWGFGVLGSGLGMATSLQRLSVGLGSRSQPPQPISVAGSRNSTRRSHSGTLLALAPRARSIIVPGVVVGRHSTSSVRACLAVCSFAAEGATLAASASSASRSLRACSPARVGSRTWLGLG